MDSKWVIPLGFCVTMGLSALWSLSDAYKAHIHQAVMETADMVTPYGNKNKFFDLEEFQGIGRDVGRYFSSIDELTLDEKKEYLDKYGVEHDFLTVFPSLLYKN